MIREIDPIGCCSGGTLTGGSNTKAKPTRKEITAKVQQAYDTLWYVRHQQLGAPGIGLKSAQEIECKYGLAALDLCDECVLRLEGRLGALRWVLYGSAIDNSDT